MSTRDTALRQVGAATRKLRSAESQFEKAIRTAADGRAPQRAIAEACGLSLTRVNQIVHGRNK
jgi:Winged helix-turn-helix DNA-binding